MPTDIQRGSIVRGPMLPEPIEVVTTVRLGQSLQLVGKGLETGKFYDPVLTEEQVAELVVSGDRPAFDGDARLFRLGVEAHRLGLAYEYDPYFSLSIARVDPLPHQIEAVYHYFLKLPRIRFLLSDDPGAGKTIMAGLLLKELKARGLVKRVLIVTPANLTFQWQRELKDKFREQFTVIGSSLLRANYGQNPWQEHKQIVTSISWVSTVDDARESLLRSRWDLVIVDEAHKMAAYSDRTTLAYDLGKKLGDLTDHFLLMTATPHKGDAENFCRFLELLDKDVYGNVQSLEEAMKRQDAPFYLRRTKEALVTFPDPETGLAKKLFTKREVRTAEFKLDGDELEFYDDLTKYVEDQSILAVSQDAVRGRAVGFTMAMLQRRMASTVYAVRRTLERMRDKRQRILDDPEAYRREQLEKLAARERDDFDDLEENEQAEILEKLEEVVASVDPASLRDEISRLKRLIDKARQLEAREAESKLARLRAILEHEGVFKDPQMKLLVFTEHKDSLDFLAGDGKDRPLGKLREWGLTVTTIHGGMKIGDRDTPGTRIHAEREFRESAQVLVATEAAGEGINLQFCWFLVNYDIPWNPVRLEQRLGRIHRYGQEKDCLIFNFVATNTREGRVLQKLHDRLVEIRSELGTDQVFDVVGEILPANTIQNLFREMYLRRTTEDAVTNRLVRDVDVERFRRITESRIEMLAKRELNMSAIVGRSIEAKEARLVPEAIEQFFVESAPHSGVKPKETGPGTRVYKIGKVPRPLVSIGDKLEPRFGHLGREYGRVGFDKEILKADATIEWVTPGHPLFEVIRDDACSRAVEHFEKGAVFYDLHRKTPATFDVYGASIKDGSDRTLHRRLFVVECRPDGEMIVRRPTAFHDIVAAPPGAACSDLPLPRTDAVKAFLHDRSLKSWCAQISKERQQEIETIERHVEISLNALITRHQESLADYLSKYESQGRDLAQDVNVRDMEQHLDELANRLERRRTELRLERNVLVADVQLVGRAWVLPHPERDSPALKPMVRDEEIEKIAIEFVKAHEIAQGFEVESVESENRGYDLISRRRHPEDPKTFTLVKFLEVKGRGGVGDVAVTTNEYRAADRLRADYWLYVVFDCATPKPRLEKINDPVRLGWQPIVKIEHYRIGPSAITAASEKA